MAPINTDTRMALQHPGEQNGETTGDSPRLRHNEVLLMARNIQQVNY